ncbi:MAG: hypothetical protein KF805_08410 [Phycisphaeraceae bacterium]|nr:hypothetical protein [Phycisphaeraceae bacterium]
MKVIPLVILAALALGGCKSPSEVLSEQSDAKWKQDQAYMGHFPQVNVGDPWPEARAKIKAAQVRDGIVVIGDYRTEQIGNTIQYTYQVSRPIAPVYYWVLIQDDTVIGVGGPT